MSERLAIQLATEHLASVGITSVKCLGARPPARDSREWMVVFQIIIPEDPAAVVDGPLLVSVHGVTRTVEVLPGL